MALVSWKDLMEKAEKEGGSTDITGNIPAGQYNFRVLSAEWVEGGSWKGIRMNTEVEDGPYKGKRVFKTFFISDNGVSLGIMFRQLRAIGFDTEWMGNLPNDIPQACTIIASNLPNRRFVGIVGPQKNKPEYMEIRNILTQKVGPLIADGSPAAAPSSVAPPTASPVAAAPLPGPVSAPAAPTASPVAAPAVPWSAPPVAPAPAAPAPATPAPTAPAADPWTAQPPAAPVATPDPWDVQPPTPPAL